MSSSTPPLRFEGPRPPAVELWHAALHDRTKLVPATPPPDMTNLPPELAPPGLPRERIVLPTPTSSGRPGR